MLIFEINTSNLLYIGRINVIMGFLQREIAKFDESPFMLNQDGELEFYGVTELFKHRWPKLVLPMTSEVFGKINAYLSITSNLTKKRNITNVGALPVVNLIEAKNRITISSGTMSNYKAAMKWFHECENVNIGKISVDWPASLQKKSHKMMKTYKNDVGDKKRRGNHVFH